MLVGFSPTRMAASLAARSSPSRRGPSAQRSLRPTRRPPGSRTWSVHTCQVLRPRRVAQALAFALLDILPSATQTASAPGISFLSRLNGWPVRSPTDASPTSSRMPAHGSGPMWFAIPSSWFGVSFDPAGPSIAAADAASPDTSKSNYFSTDNGAIERCRQSQTAVSSASRIQGICFREPVCCRHAPSDLTGIRALPFIFGRRFLRASRSIQVYGRR